MQKEVIEELSDVLELMHTALDVYNFKTVGYPIFLDNPFDLIHKSKF